MKRGVVILASIYVVMALALACASEAEAKNVFYGLAAHWCDKGGQGPERFEILDDGSLVYDWSKRRVCQIKNITNMDQPFGDYVVTWRCNTGERQEKLSTFFDHDAKGGRRFFLTRGGKTFEQCRCDAGNAPSFCQ